MCTFGVIIDCSRHCDSWANSSLKLQVLFTDIKVEIGAVAAVVIHIKIIS